MSQSKVPIEAIRGLITDALAAAGLPREDAAKCAELMGEADLTGADAHGVFRLPQYVRRLKAGGFNPKPEHHGAALGARHRAGRWRQRDGTSGDVARGRDGNFHRARDGRVVGRRAALQSCGSGRALCRDAGRAGHDRHLCGGREREPHGGVGRRRSAARHQSAGDRRAVGRGADGARHGDHGRVVRHGEELRAAGKAHGEGLDGEHRDRRGHHRRQARGRRTAACRSAATRAQGSP